MINLDDYINRTVDFTIDGEVVKVQEPSNALFKKITEFEGMESGPQVFDAQVSIVTEMLNRNKSNKKFDEKEVAKMPQGAVNRIIKEVAALTRKAINDPN